MEEPELETWRRLANHRLLTAAEEVALARRVQAGGEDGQRAKHELCMFNVRLLMAVAGKYVGRGIELGDLCQTAFVGLNRAAEKFDPDLGYRFSTYATRWLHQACQRAVEKADVIHMPGQVKRAWLTLHNEPELTYEEVAQRTKVPVSRVVAASGAARVVGSLDATAVRDGDFGSAYDAIPDPDATAEPPDDSAWVRELLHVLNALERQVIEMHFGLNGYGGAEHTLEDIATMTGLTKTKIQNVRATALRKLREAVRPDEVR